MDCKNHIFKKAMCIGNRNPKTDPQATVMRPLDREKELELMVQIVAGLLASGHFTYNNDGQAGVLVQPRKSINGKFG